MGDRETFPFALAEGTVLAGQYVIKRVLGEGGFGITYEAEDHKTGIPVAVKEFFPDSMASRSQGGQVSAFPGERGENFAYGKDTFLQEARTLSEFIGNENIVRVHSYFEENGTAYFSMDFVKGTSLDRYIKEKGGKLDYEEAERLLVPVMDALQAVHEKGIVHRDVSPDNIYITEDGTVKLLDFGAARYSLGDKSRSLDVILKHGYAPREQYSRHGRQGPFTDVYALGATFYFTICGRRPVDSIDRMDEDILVPPSNLGVKIPQGKEEVLLKAMSVNPQDRYQSMAEFKAALLAASGNTSAQPYAAGQPYATGQQNASVQPYAAGQLNTPGQPYAQSQPYTQEQPYAAGQQSVTGQQYATGQQYVTGQQNASVQPYAAGQLNTPGQPYAQNQPYTQEQPYAAGQQYPAGQQYASNQPNAPGQPYVQEQPIPQGQPYAQSQPSVAEPPHAPEVSYQKETPKQRSGGTLGKRLALIAVFFLLIAAGVCAVFILSDKGGDTDSEERSSSRESRRSSESPAGSSQSQDSDNLWADRKADPTPTAAPTPAEDDWNGEPEEITFMVWDDIEISYDLISKGYKQSIDRFNSDYEGKYHCTIIHTNLEEYYTKLNAMIAAGDTPDVFIVSPGANLDDYVLPGVAAKLDDYLYADGWIDSFTSEAVLSGGTYGNEAADGAGVYAIPLNIAAACVFYNTEMFVEAGVPVPTTYSELIEACEKLKERTGYTPISCSAGTGWCLSMIAAYLCDRNGLDLEDIRAHRTDWYDAKVIKAGNQIQELSQYFQPTAASDDNDHAVSAFYNGKAAMLIQGSWAIGQINGSCAPGFEQKIGVFAFPAVEGSTADPSRVIAKSDSLSMSASSRHKDGAIALMRYFVDDTAQKYTAEYGGKIPVTKVRYDESIAPPELAYVMDVFKNANSSFGFYNESLADSEAGSIYDSCFVDIFNGTDPKTAMKPLQKYYESNVWR